MDKWLDPYPKKIVSGNFITWSNDLLAASALFLSKDANNSNKGFHKIIIDNRKNLKLLLYIIALFVLLLIQMLIVPIEILSANANY